MQLIKWNLTDDSFEPGQWFKGRIYEKRCDLSPDGTKLIYFAQKINRRTLRDAEYTYAWTAISRPPYLTALALWPKGDCWNGGGLFETSTRIWLNHFVGHARPHERHPPRGLEVAYNEGERGEDDTVLHKRLPRDGWRLLQEWKGRFIESDFASAYREMIDKGFSSDEMLAESLRRKLYELDTNSRYVTDAPEIREKPGADGRFTLVMTMEIQGFKAVYRFAVKDAKSGSLQPVPGAEWADWDRRGRLVFVGSGRVFAAQPSAVRASDRMELADFNANAPEAVEAPEWARVW